MLVERKQPANPWLSAVRELGPEEEKLLSVLRDKPWIADCQPAPPEYVGCDALINYLASYISGTAISNRRMLVVEDDRVEFVIKDYKHKRISSEKLTGTEFVQRFALHILPARMQRMRYAGLFQAEGLKNRLEVCRAALGEYQLNHPDSQQSNQPKQPPSPDQWREDEDEQVEASEFSNGMKCQCGQLMESAERIEPVVTMKMIDFVRETVSQTLPMLLGEVIGRLLAELQQTRSRHRISRRMRLYDSEVDVLYVLLSEAMPAKENEMEGDPADPTHQHLSGIPPPRKRFTHDDSTVTEYA